LSQQGCAVLTLSPEHSKKESAQSFLTLGWHPKLLQGPQRLDQIIPLRVAELSEIWQVLHQHQLSLTIS
jgi:hypothetical protein